MDLILEEAEDETNNNAMRK